MNEPIEGVGVFSKVIVNHDFSILYGGKKLHLKKGESSALYPEMEEEGYHNLYVSIKVKRY